MNVLVSGIGSDIGLGVARVLKEWNVFDKVYGVDIHSDHPGHFVLEKCFIVPRANEHCYIKNIQSLIDDLDITLFIPTSEAEIDKISSLGLKKIGNAKLLINEQNVVDGCLDKHKCLQTLADSAISVPKNGVIGISIPEDYPVVVKPRSGQGSKHVAIVHDEQQFKKCTIGYVWQELLMPSDEEYTCPVFRSPNVETRILIIKRKLIGGLTGSGKVVSDSAIENYITQIVELFDLNGAINIQLRKTKNGPLLFEINPRISSTVVFRDKLGFCDLRWWVNKVLDRPIGNYVRVQPGTKFYRGSCEYIEEVEE